MPACSEPARQPERGRAPRVEAGDGARTSRSAAVGVGDHAGVARRRRSAAGRGRPGRGTARRTPWPPRGRCRASTGQYAAVRGDGDVEDLVAQAEQLDRVGAEPASPTGGSTRMPAWSSPMPELARRADHAVADVAVGLARGDREAAGQHGAGQRDDDVVADGEVARAADDAPRLGRRRRRPGSSGSVLPLECGLLLDGEHPADDERARRRRGPAARRSRPRGRRATSRSASVAAGRRRPAGRRTPAARTAGRASDLRPERDG